MDNRTSIPAEIKRNILVECGHRCAVCGVPTPLECAHIIPWSKSGEHKVENLICLCASCHERADKESWGEKVLRKYKQKPWVIRQYEKEDSISDNNTTKVTLTIEELPDLNETSQRYLLSTIAESLDIPRHAVHIVSIDKDSKGITD